MFASARPSQMLVSRSPLTRRGLAGVALGGFAALGIGLRARGEPLSPAAEPTVVGLVMVKLCGPAPWVAAAVVGLAIVAMHLTETFHPPSISPRWRRRRAFLLCQRESGRYRLFDGQMNALKVATWGCAWGLSWNPPAANSGGWSPALWRCRRYPALRCRRALKIA
jgi:HPP family